MLVNKLLQRISKQGSQKRDTKTLLNQGHRKLFYGGKMSAEMLAEMP